MPNTKTLIELQKELDRYKSVVSYAAKVLPLYVSDKPTSTGVDICLASFKKLEKKPLSQQEIETLDCVSNPIKI